MILKEYALDPTIIYNWDRCRAFMGLFGVEYGRQVSGFPKYKNWKNMLLQNLNVLPKEKARIIEYINIKKNRNKAFLKKSRLYKRDEQWPENAIRENSKSPFQAIIIGDKSYHCENVVYDDECSEFHPLLAASVSVPICRNVTELTMHVTPLLDQSKRILFVDPYFYGTNSKFLRPLRQFARIISKNPLSLNRISIEYHHNNGGSVGFPTKQHKLAVINVNWKNKIESNLPSAIEVKFYMWDFRDLHNRYILTDIYGVQYGRGLSEDTSGFADEDEILGLDIETYKLRWKKYTNNAPIPYMVCSGT